MLDILSSLSEQDWELIISSFALSAWLALSSTLILIVLCTPLAWFLARRNSWWKFLLQAVFCLPLVLPPSVLGFYLLVMLNPNSFLGNLWFTLTAEQLLFSFNALLIASLIYSLPFVLQPLVSAFEQTSQDFLDLARTLGASPWQSFSKVVLPMNASAYLIAFSLGFAHTLGEFGVVLLVGGNIAGETRVMSIAIYEQVEMMNYQVAHIMALLVVVVSLLLLLPVYTMNGNLLRFSFRASSGEKP